MDELWWHVRPSCGFGMVDGFSVGKCGTDHESVIVNRFAHLIWIRKPTMI
jgi:hypothetical protein